MVHCVYVITIYSKFWLKFGGSVNKAQSILNVFLFYILMSLWKYKNMF